MVQWWKMGNAKNLAEFKAALKDVQIPFFNIMYADKEGNIFYMFNGQVPRRKTGDWNYWSDVVDGTKSENIWTDVLSYDELPKLENPKTGWLQNANDPPWTSTYPPLLDPKKYPSYLSPIEMGFRPQRAVRMMKEDDSISFEELVEDKVSTRIEMADRFLDDLSSAVEKYGNADAKEAMIILNNWDRQANADSKGMALFYAWAHGIQPWKSSNYSDKWTIEDAFNHPQTLAHPEEAAKVLEGVVAQFKENGVPLDIAWGDQYRIKYNGKEYPGNGADGSVGIFRVAWSNGLEEDGKYYISGGDSWQSVIEFSDRIHAKVLLSYGNSTQPGDRNNGDQLSLFSKKEMRECTFYKEDVLKNIALKESLIDGRFVIKR
jgi:acyl-homoserine-lactone acylase